MYSSVEQNTRTAYSSLKQKRSSRVRSATPTSHLIVRQPRYRDTPFYARHLYYACTCNIFSCVVGLLGSKQRIQQWTTPVVERHLHEQESPLSLNAQRAACERGKRTLAFGVDAFMPKFYGKGSSPAKMLILFNR